MSAPKFLTTKEVAALLRVKERKIYELVSSGAIPVSRVTGKLLFPRDMVEMWVRRHTDLDDPSLLEPPAVLAGSHDPLLEWALRESGSGIATFFDGSLSGLERLGAGKALAIGLHVYDPESSSWNRPTVERALAGLPLVLVHWAKRQQGLVVPRGNPRRVRRIEDLAGVRFMPRQASAGGHLLFSRLLGEAGLDASDLELVSPPARNETEVALGVSDAKADAGFAIEAVARQLRLDFIPLIEEHYALALRRREFFEPPFQALLAFCRSAAFSRRAGELGGYDISELGRIEYNAP